MLSRAIFVLTSMLLATSSALASPTVTIEAPATYTPGETFQCQVILTGVDHLASFTMDLILSSSSGAAGTDFSFDDAETPDTWYVFTGESTVGFSHSTPGDSQVTIGDSLSDLTKEVSTAAGVNDLLALVTIQTSAQMSGILSISFDPDYLYLDNKDGSSIPYYNDLVESLAPTTLAVVPEPASLLLVSGGLGAVLLRRRARR